MRGADEEQLYEVAGHEMLSFSLPYTYGLWYAKIMAAVLYRRHTERLVEQLHGNQKKQWDSRYETPPPLVGACGPGKS
jgi:hypothetical protein